MSIESAGALMLPESGMMRQTPCFLSSSWASSCCYVDDRGTQASRLVRCFSSHPSIMCVEPADAFMLPANSLQELHVGIRPMFASACSQLMYINVVDVELHQVLLFEFLDFPLVFPCHGKFRKLKLKVLGSPGKWKFCVVDWFTRHFKSALCSTNVAVCLFLFKC